MRLIEINKISYELGITDFEVVEILTASIAHYESDFKNLKNAIYKKDFEKIQLYSHKLKGSFSYFNIKSISNLCLNIEIKSENKENYNYEAEFVKIMSLFNQFQKEVNEL